MAKRGRAAGSGSRAGSGRSGAPSEDAKPEQTNSSAAERKIVHYAEELGRIVGAMRGRADNWNDERQRLIKRLSSMVGEAQNLLSDLEQRAQHEANRVAPARPAAVMQEATGTPRKRRRTPTARTSTASARKKRIG